VAIGVKDFIPIPIFRIVENRDHIVTATYAFIAHSHDFETVAPYHAHSCHN